MDFMKSARFHVNVNLADFERPLVRNGNPMFSMPWQVCYVNRHSFFQGNCISCARKVHDQCSADISVLCVS